MQKKKKKKKEKEISTKHTTNTKVEEEVLEKTKQIQVNEKK